MDRFMAKGLSVGPAVLFLMIFLVSMFFAFSGGPEGVEISHLKKLKISWQEPLEEKGIKIRSGSVNADFGRFNFRWMIGRDGSVRLITLESPGGGEMPAVEKKVLPLVVNEGTAVLFLEWPALLNEKKPVIVRAIAGVSAGELFSALPGLKRPPVSPQLKNPLAILWSGIRDRKGVQYLQGSVKASFGTLNLYWKKEEGRVPELITVESPGGGELPPVEAKLLPWMDDASGLTVICQERHPQLNERFPVYLYALAVVKTADLMSGFDRLDR